MHLLKAMLQHHLLQHFILEQFEKKVERLCAKQKNLFIIFAPFTLLIVPSLFFHYLPQAYQNKQMNSFQVICH